MPKLITNALYIDKGGICSLDAKPLSYTASWKDNAYQLTITYCNDAAMGTAQMENDVAEHYFGGGLGTRFCVNFLCA